jgi:predicted small metal-binding protein
LQSQIPTITLKLKRGGTMADHTTGEKELSRRDFRQDCGFTVRAKTEKEILNKCQAHVCRAHGKCSISSEMREKIRSHIRNVV